MENKIGMAMQEGGFVRIYDENGSKLPAKVHQKIRLSHSLSKQC